MKLTSAQYQYVKGLLDSQEQVKVALIDFPSWKGLALYTAPPAAPNTFLIEFEIS